MTATSTNVIPRLSLGERLATRAAGLVIAAIGLGYRARARATEAERGPVLVQVNFRHLDDHRAFRRKMDGFAPLLAALPGLLWKVWADDEATGAATGCYLFETREQARFYLDEVFPQGMGTDPEIADVTIRLFDVLPHASRLTRAID